jgi:predicted thioesterase
MLTFKVTAYAGDELIGEGTHQRCIIFNDRFMEKTLAKLNK